jgi:hypothetical protein
VLLHPHRHASQVLVSLPVLLLHPRLPNLLRLFRLQLFLEQPLRLRPVLSILKKRNSMLVNRLCASRRRSASRAFAVSRKKKERRKRRGSVKKPLVYRESRKKLRVKRSRSA